MDQVKDVVMKTTEVEKEKVEVIPMIEEVIMMKEKVEDIPMIEEVIMTKTEVEIEVILAVSIFFFFLFIHDPVTQFTF